MSDWFHVTYQIHTGARDDAEFLAWDLGIEQTVEFPSDLIPNDFIRDHVVGRTVSLEQRDESTFEAVLAYPVHAIGGELTQFLNVLFGNSSIKKNIRLTHFEVPTSLAETCTGPLFGATGLRDLLGVHDRPLFCTALKPMGLRAHDLAEIAYQFALGGIDIIKDDHGLANQPYAPFEERIRLVSEAVARANGKTGGRTLYAPNVTSGPQTTLDRAHFAAQNGAQMLLISPGLCGFETMRIAGCQTQLPIMSHPAFAGGFVASNVAGISHRALFGQIQRLAGADAVVFPHHGGRFPFTENECRHLLEGLREPMGKWRAAMPTPGGGMTLKRVPEIVEFYGRDVILLIGGGLFRSGNLVESCKQFRTEWANELK